MNVEFRIYERNSHDAQYSIVSHGCSPILAMLDDFWLILNRGHREFFAIAPDGKVYSEVVEQDYRNSDAERQRFRSLVSQVGGFYARAVPDTSSLYERWRNAGWSLHHSSYYYDNERKEWLNVNQV